ncbi:MAG: dihydrofolate reductase family protein [Ignavibacteriae bacterium]|nr:dihydrofolate reductase family protein [Ignavibacteriota bacterium]
MRKLVLFVHVSLDGFVAGPKGEMNWIHIDDEIFDYVGKRIEKTDAALYGRITYQMMEDYWPTAADKPDASKHDIEHSKWYSQAGKIILSKTIQENDKPNTKVISNDLKTEINSIKQSEGSEILIFGSPSAAHSLMELDLIDGYWLFVNPVLIGKGIPLFKNIGTKQNLKMTGCKVFSSGVICTQYEKEEPMI